MSVLASVALALILGAASSAPGIERDRARAEALEAAAEGHPGTPAAADELLAAASLYESRLYEFERAAALYRRVDGARAAARLDRLQPLLAPPREAGLAWAALLRPPRTESEDQARALIERYPSWPGVGNAHLWLGDQALGAGRLGPAREHLLAARKSPSAGVRRDALRSLVQLGLTAGDLGDAEDALAMLRAEHQPLSLHEQTLAARVRVEGERRHLLWLSLGVLLASLLLLGAVLWRGAGSLSAAVRELARMPGEVLFVAPVFAILIVFALVRVREYIGLLSWVSVAGLLFTWLSMVSLRVRARSVAWTAGIAMAAVLGVVASVYVALYATEMLDSIADTMREGGGH